jgi:hypothetical protein
VQDFSGLSEEDQESSYCRRKKKIKQRKNILKTCSDDCFLKFESSQNSYFIDLKLEDVNIYENSDKNLSILAHWDSSEHKSKLMNQVTHQDKHIYLTLKLHVRMKLLNENDEKRRSIFVNVIMRKRICVFVSLNGSLINPSQANLLTSKILGLGRIKNILGNQSQNQASPKLSNRQEINHQTLTSLTYRFISVIPKFLTEIENRESLAMKAANSMTEELINQLSSNDQQQQQLDSPIIENKYLLNAETSCSYLEHYAKTIEAVDSILKRDRLRQQNKLKQIINNYNKKGSIGDNNDMTDLNENDFQDNISVNESSFNANNSLTENSQMKKTFSVPNLIKTVGIFTLKNKQRMLTNN